MASSTDTSLSGNVVLAGLGPQGPRGGIGADGLRGQAGLLGPIGNQGPQGVAGSQGGGGSQGPQGHQGFQGVQGPQGVPGSGGAGSQGPQGPQGSSTGTQGPQGLTGPQGPGGGDQGPQGPQGEIGPGLVYRGVYDPAQTYYNNAVRRDVVSHPEGTYFYTNNPAKSGLATWDTPPGADWLAFTGFTAVATDLLLAQDVAITRTLTLGTAGGNDGIIQSANYVPFVSGFILRQNGFAEFQEVLINGKLANSCAFFNVTAENNTFPATSGQEAEATPNLNNFPPSGTRVPLLEYKGWELGSPGIDATRYGKADGLVFACQAIAGFGAIGSGYYASVEIVYSTDGGTTWTQVNGIEASIHDPNTFICVAGGKTVSGLSATGTLKFALNFKSPSASATILYCKLQVQVFNV